MKYKIEKQAFIVQKLPQNTLIYLKIPQEKSEYLNENIFKFSKKIEFNYRS